MSEPTAKPVWSRFCALTVPNWPSAAGFRSNPINRAMKNWVAEFCLAVGLLVSTATGAAQADLFWDFSDPPPSPGVNYLPLGWTTGGSSGTSGTGIPFDIVPWTIFGNGQFVGPAAHPGGFDSWAQTPALRFAGPGFIRLQVDLTINNSNGAADAFELSAINLRTGAQKIITEVDGIPGQYQERFIAEELDLSDLQLGENGTFAIRGRGYERDTELDFRIRVDNLLLGNAELAPPSPDHRWIAAAGAWHAAGNWAPAGAPAADWVAKLINEGTAPRIATVNADNTVRQIQLGSPAASMTLQLQLGTLRATESVVIEPGGFLRLDLGVLETPVLHVKGGSVIVNNPFLKVDRMTVEPAGSLRMASAGVLAIETGFENRGSSEVGTVVNNGLLVQSAGSFVAQSLAGVGDAYVSGGTFSVQNVLQRTLVIDPGQTATVRPNGEATGLSTVAGLSIGAGGSLDLNDNDLIVRYSDASPLAAIRQQILDGLLNTPNAPRIDSSYGAAMDGDGPLTMLHVPFDNAMVGATEWLGQSLDGGKQIVVKFTFLGDANLDGEVNEQDYLPVDNNFGAVGDWLHGDVNLDGVVDVGDYVTIDNAFGRGRGNPLGSDTAAPSAVPEPSGLFLAMGTLPFCAGLLVAGWLAGRRRGARGLAAS